MTPNPESIEILDFLNFDTEGENAEQKVAPNKVDLTDDAPSLRFINVTASRILFLIVTARLQKVHP